MNIKYIFLTAVLSLATCLTAQVQPVHADLENPESFSMILFPDPQTYIKYDVNQPIFELMTAWTANNADRLNIKTVLCTGDLVEQNDRSYWVKNGKNGNQTSKEQWNNVSRAFERLDNILPYVLATGNHDYGYTASEKRFTSFPEYFYPERNNKLKGVLTDMGRNYADRQTLENAAYEFSDPNWGNILIVSLEFAPRPEMIEWAKKLIQKDEYKDHKVILLTHSYMNVKAERFEKEGYGLTPATYGEAIWEQLVSQCPNIGLVLCGHAADGTSNHQTNVSYRVDKNAAGKDVAQMMFNAQSIGGGWHGNGGDGWLRILEFMPDGKTIGVRTFSPLFAISPITAEHAWRGEDYDQFEITWGSGETK